MRVSLTARFLSRPTIDFGATRRPTPRALLGLSRPTTTYHRPQAATHLGATLAALRSHTTGYRFPSVCGSARGLNRRTALPLGLQRARRG
jgi:hypothetical protein